ncbi:hypothetical protein SGRA_2016 [Saprospira grandis str. Lewin]|uniref:Uncharacterized protein n=1 Tax=Saprospira grandis (strain Lewin) TaxID=984262 RepID=H6L2A9_SAPGL|nr:hypothetical protein SGRA_2016 [Saprospira grandis str. Lewin]
MRLAEAELATNCFLFYFFAKKIATKSCTTSKSPVHLVHNKKK